MSPAAPVGDPGTGRMVASVVHDGRRDEVAVEEPLEIRVDGTPLAVALAADRGLTLAGFARHARVNVYTGGERVAA